MLQIFRGIHMTNENGVSEIVGAILLVALVIVAMMIVAVALLSQPPPQEIPQVNALAGNNTSHIFIQNNGGDSLTPLETIIRIDGNPDPVPPEDITLVDENGNSITPWTSGDWSVGSTLVIKDTRTPQSVSLIYNGGSAQALIFTATFVQQPITSPTTSPLTTGTTTIPTTSTTTTATTTVTTTATTTIPTTSPPSECYISGYKWNDLDGNGKWDTGEPALSGWTINLYDSVSNQPYVYNRSTTTNSQGYYIFTFTDADVHAGRKYKVDETLQAGWTNTYPSGGSYSEIVLNPGVKCQWTDLDFGNKWVPDFEGSPTEVHLRLR